MSINKNIFNIIKENATEKLDDFIIYDGYIINKQFLIDSGYENDYLKNNTSLFPIYISGKHPIVTPSGESINLSKIYDKNSHFYQTGNYYEICVKDADDTNTPSAGDSVRIYYNKAKNKTYSIGYFKIIKKDALKTILDDNSINQSNSSLDTSDTSITNSFNKINYTKITLTFDTLFNSLIGNIIIYKYNKLSINLYAIAYRESNINPYAIGDTGKSQGLFQINRSRWNDVDLQNFINNGFNFININNKLINTFTTIKFDDSLDSKKGINNLDTQIIAYIGFLNTNNILNNLIDNSLQDKNIFNSFSNVQRFLGYNDIASYNYNQYYNEVYTGYNNGLPLYNNYLTKLKSSINTNIIAKNTNGLEDKYKKLVNYLL